MDWLTFLVPRYLYYGTSRYNDVIEVVETFGNRKLLVNGITQSGRYPSLLFHRGLQVLHNWHVGPMNRVLVFGVGGGGIFQLLHRMYVHSHIVGVEIDAQILRVAKKYFDIYTIPNTTYVVSDAKQYAKQSKLKAVYDCVIIDLYIGNAVPDFVDSQQFFRDVKGLLRAKGSVMFNYFAYTHQSEIKQHMLAMLCTIFPHVDMKSNHKNVFFYCRT